MFSVELANDMWLRSRLVDEASFQLYLWREVGASLGDVLNSNLAMAMKLVQ